MAYIANKPVRFDRDYKVGETIPDGVIAPGMSRKLEEMGRILRVDLPRDNDQIPQENARDSATYTDAREGGGSDDGAFVCEVCGRAFKAQNALTAHARSHKE